MASIEEPHEVQAPIASDDKPQGPLLTSGPASPTFEPVPANLLTEIRAFEADSLARYRFNNRWDIVLSVLGILLSIAVVAAGFLKSPEVSAVLGAIVGAVVTAQKAFPFGQRAAFYRLLIGQASNLTTRASQGSVNKFAVVDALSALRMDFAQQLPRGSSSQTNGTSASAISGPTIPSDGESQEDRKPL